MVATQGFDLRPQLEGALVVTPGEGHSQSEFQLFQQMLTLSSAPAGHRMNGSAGRPAPQWKDL